MSETGTELREAIETIERAYEFMLAYAAQGRDFEDTDGTGPSIRAYLTDLAGALSRIGDLVSDCGAEEKGFARFQALLAADADKSLAAVEMVLLVSSISSQLIDNLNASIHLRALLTDLFLFDEAYKGL